MLLGIVLGGNTQNVQAVPSEETAPAILLFIGDGMGEAHRTAARWSAVGQSGQLIMDILPVSGWSQTASADSAITDSAAAATAMATGGKTNNGMIGINPEGETLTTILELAQDRGWAVGLVTTVQISHATPASFAAHVPDRNQMTDIALQMIEHHPEVLLGGGEDEFIPPSETGCFPESGERSDGRNLISEAIASDYTYVCDTTSLEAVNPIATTYLLGLFADEGMSRPYAPSLAAMTDKAIAILSRDPEGFFLMVEGGQIDWPVCRGPIQWTRAVRTKHFDRAVHVPRSMDIPALSFLWHLYARVSNNPALLSGLHGCELLSAACTGPSFECRRGYRRSNRVV